MYWKKVIASLMHLNKS